MRRSASSSTTSRPGSACASGMPGAPPPLPTSTIAPSKRATSSAPRERVVEQHAPRLGGIAERRQAGRRDDRREPVVKRGGRRRTDSAPSPRSPSARPATSLQPLVHDLPLDRASSARAARARRATARSALRIAIPSSVVRRRLAVAGRVDRHRLARAAAVDGRVRDVLQRVDRLAVLADQQTRARRRCTSTTISSSVSRTRRAQPMPDRADDSLDELAHARARPPTVVGAAAARGASAVRPPRRSRAPACSPTPSRPRSPSETTWKRTLALSMPGRQALEVAQRLPLRLADGLARSPPRRPHASPAHRRAPPFFA